jgi:5-formyltetrahydrofolate cyclo-ligase
MKAEYLQAQPSSEEIKNQKAALRQFWRKQRGQIPISRRKKAEYTIKRKLISFSNSHRYVLSYQSFDSELNTHSLNEYLAKQGKLLLAKVENQTLKIYRVPDIHHCLQPHAWGILEPIPERCYEVEADSIISLILVPGLAFDSCNHRLGYGKGYYDRLLAKLPKETVILGLGFKEQRSSEPLPVSTSDHPLHKVLLF